MQGWTALYSTSASLHSVNPIGENRHMPKVCMFNMCSVGGMYWFVVLKDVANLSYIKFLKALLSF